MLHSRAERSVTAPSIRKRSLGGSSRIGADCSSSDLLQVVGLGDIANCSVAALCNGQLAGVKCSLGQLTPLSFCLWGHFQGIQCVHSPAQLPSSMNQPNGLSTSHSIDHHFTNPPEVKSGIVCIFVDQVFVSSRDFSFWEMQQ